MLDADGYLFGTPANFGYMSGALKHFFDTVYYPVLDHVRESLPLRFVGAGNDDTAGAVSSVQRIATGLGLRPAAVPLCVTGLVGPDTRRRASELGGTPAALLMK